MTTNTAAITEALAVLAIPSGHKFTADVSERDFAAALWFYQHGSTFFCSLAEQSDGAQAALASRRLTLLANIMRWLRTYSPAPNEREDFQAAFAELADAGLGSGCVRQEWVDRTTETKEAP